jgi:GDP-L-fucose synthase
MTDYLITGGSGFLGSHLVESLEADGMHVAVPRSNAFDLTHEAQVADLFAAETPRVVYHLAAEVGGIGANRANPGRYWYSNLMMGVNVLEQARIAGVEKVVMVGTICSYPKFAPIPFQEEDLWNGYPEETNAPYGVAKKALIVGAAAYREQYGLDAVCVLPVNLYGPRDNFDLQTSHVIPALIRKMVDAEARGESMIELWGDGSPTREFLYVEDCVRGLRLAETKLETSEPVNLGTGREISIRDLAERIRLATGFAGEISWNADYPNGQPRRCLDTSRAERLMGFSATTEFETGLASTVEWYRANC